MPRLRRVPAGGSGYGSDGANLRGLVVGLPIGLALWLMLALLVWWIA